MLFELPGIICFDSTFIFLAKVTWREIFLSGLLRNSEKKRHLKSAGNKPELIQILGGMPYEAEDNTEEEMEKCQIFA